MIKSLLSTICIMLLCVSLSAQPARARTPQNQQTQNTNTQTIDIPENGCDFIIMPQPPKKKRTANKREQLPVDPYPNKMEAYICFEPASAYYTEAGLDILDSIYSIAFNKENNKFYKMTIEAYDDAEPLNELNADRKSVV